MYKKRIRILTDLYFSYAEPTRPNYWITDGESIYYLVRAYKNIVIKYFY